MSCPLCGNENYEKIKRMCSNMKILGKDFPEGDNDVVVCTKCGLVYTHAAATQEDYLSYYSSDVCNPPVYYDAFGKKESDDYFEHILGILRPYIKENCKILDIAGSWGELGAYIEERTDKTVRVTVADVNKKCVTSARNLELDAFEVSSFDLADKISKKFDIVILNHALEHILDIPKTIENIKQVLKPNGYIFIEVPDLEEYVNQEEVPYCYLTYEHVVHMSFRDLRNIAALYGMKIICMEKYYKAISHYPSIYAIMQIGEQILSPNIVFSDENKKCMLRYIEKCKEQLKKKLAFISGRGDKLILWGIGASTALLLEDFIDCNVIQLIDRNTLRQGIIYQIGSNKYTIEDPTSIDDDTAYIFILSVAYKNLIQKQIKEMGLKNPVISFD